MHRTEENYQRHLVTYLESAISGYQSGNVTPEQTLDMIVRGLQSYTDKFKDGGDGKVHVHMERKGTDDEPLYFVNLIQFPNGRQQEFKERTDFRVLIPYEGDEVILHRDGEELKRHLARVYQKDGECYLDLSIPEGE